MAEESKPEDYPQEIDEQLASFGSSLCSVRTMLEKLMSMPRNELLKLEPLDQAKLDLMSAYTLNSLFWMYLVTQGVNPREHAIKQELERIRTYMNKVKEITDRKKMARLDKDAAGRFLKSALYDPKEKDFRRKEPHEAPHRTPHRAPLVAPLGMAQWTPLRAAHGTPSGATKSKRPKRS